VALLALVALASTSRLEDGGTGVPSWLALLVLVVAGTAALALAVGGLLVGGYASFAETRGRTKLLVGVIGALVLTALVASLFAPPPLPPGARSCSDPLLRGWVADCNKRRPPPGTRGGGEPRGSGGGRQGSSLAVAIAGGSLLAALLVAGGALLLAARRRSVPRATDAVAEESVALALEESLDDLRRERDVRRAIIACYARMERALASVGVPRRPQEAPFEYLQRALEAIAARPARTLTELFERAKFSLEPMGGREKEQAIAALEVLRAELCRLAPSGGSA
jgi:hypothetical protein